MKAYYEKNKSKYLEPERRSVRYALLDVNKIKSSVVISDDDLKVLYQRDSAQFQVPNRVHVEHILLFTRGRIPRQKSQKCRSAPRIAEGTKKRRQIRGFAKKYSEDTQTKIRAATWDGLCRARLCVV